MEYSVFKEPKNFRETDRCKMQDVDRAEVWSVVGYAMLKGQVTQQADNLGSVGLSACEFAEVII